MSSGVITRTTWLTFGVLVVAVLVMFTLITLEVGGETGVLVVADIGEALVVAVSGIVILLCARRLGWKASVGRSWLLIGLGAFSYAIGDALWSVIEVGMGQEVPYPGITDVFYLLEYPLVAAGILSAGLAFRGLVPLKRATITVVVIGASLSAIVYSAFLVPHVLKVPDLTLGERILSVAYPVGDIVFMIAPAAFVLGVVAMLGGGRLGWPWWPVIAGTCLVALSDTGYAWLTAVDKYASGSVIDYGWSLGHALVMLGALIARDLSIPKTRKS